MRMTLVNKKSVFWTSTMTMIFLILMLSVIARANAWDHEDANEQVDLSEGANCNIKTGEKGICKKLSTCEVYYEGLKQKTIAYQFLVRCSFINLEEVICCPLEDTPSVTTEPLPVGMGGPIKTKGRIKIDVGSGMTLSGNEPYIDLTRILKRTTTRRPRQNVLDPETQKLCIDYLNTKKKLSEKLLFPTETTLRISDNEVSNNLDTFEQYKFRPSSDDSRPTTTNSFRPNKFDRDTTSMNYLHRPPTRQNFNSNLESLCALYTGNNNNLFPNEERPNKVQFPTEDTISNADVEVFNAIDINKHSSANLVKFPGETNDCNSGLDNGMVWGCSPRVTEGTITTSSTTTEQHGLTNWMLEALDEVSISTSTPSPRPVVAVIPFPTTPRTADSVTIRGNGNERPSQVACRRYRKDHAGLTFHILDGLPVGPGEYPHIGGLIYPSSGGGNQVDNRCGSSLISERYVLTAAHCLNDALALPTFVRLGVVEWNSTDDTPVDVEIETITLHPEYRASFRYHDIALIRLRDNVKFSVFTRPACLYSDLADVDADTKLVVAGWGVTNINTRTRSGILLQTNVTTVPLKDCNTSHADFGLARSYKSGLNLGQYCAFDPELKKDACQSDSGGPLQLVSNAESTIVGIVSFGLSCASAIPSVYVRVAYYLDWIESIVWPS